MPRLVREDHERHGRAPSNPAIVPAILLHRIGESLDPRMRHVHPRHLTAFGVPPFEASPGSEDPWGLFVGRKPPVRKPCRTSSC